VFRVVLVLLTLVIGTARGFAQGHDHGGMTPLACDPATGETCYESFLSSHHAASSPHHDASASAYFKLNAARTELSYRIDITGLDLKADPAQRTNPNDVIGVHLHLYVPDTVGPHILNIFGLATYGVPAEEDADAIFDFEHESITGVYDISDATIDPATGQPYFQFYPLTSKLIADWLEELEAGELMVAVHSAATGFPTMAIHGLINPVVPEPSAVLLSATGFATWWLVARRRIGGANRRRSG
jgi:hypothetical protein